MLRFSIVAFFISLFLAIGFTVKWVWNRFGPSHSEVYTMKAEELPLARNISNTTSCDLSIRHYRQIGREVQFELYSVKGGLSPYNVEISQHGKTQSFKNILHRPGAWFTLTKLRLQNGPTTIKIVSINYPECETVAEFDFSSTHANEILTDSRWINQGSKDIMLDVRPIDHNGKIYLKDFANYQDGRTKVYLIDDMIVPGLENGIEVQPGYFYKVVACWIDAPYPEWWNSLRNRSIRQQNIWISGKPDLPNVSASLKKIDIPEWFILSDQFTVLFDTRFPEFAPIKGKLVMQYRLNESVPPANYFKRGITHLPRWENSVPPEKTHWTEPPSFFQDKDASWFASLSRKEVEVYADRVYPSQVYAIDFEFWNQNYPPDVRQRLIWFFQRVKKNNPQMRIFDYWGGAAYTSGFLNFDKTETTDKLKKDYLSPAPTPGRTSHEPLPNGESLADYFSITPIDIYPKYFFGNDSNGITPNNYLLLSAIHNSRINRLLPRQKGNLTIWFAWNRYLPQFKDPEIAWHVTTTNPKGDLIFYGQSTMPASQALSMSLFSLIESDGYYLWHDSQPQGRGVNNYTFSETDSVGFQWFPADGVSKVTQLKYKEGQRDSPRYWDYPTEFFVLGNWMAKQVEDVLVGGKKLDLDFNLDGTWYNAGLDQAVVSAEKQLPFIMAVVNEKKIALLAVDSFQKPYAIKTIQVRLPNGKTDKIQLYGNWPSLYRGSL